MQVYMPVLEHAGILRSVKANNPRLALAIPGTDCILLSAYGSDTVYRYVRRDGDYHLEWSVHVVNPRGMVVYNNCLPLPHMVTQRESHRL